MHLGEVAHLSQQAIGDAGRASGPPGDLGRAADIGVHFEDPRGALHDRHKVVDGVEVEPGHQSETVAQRSGDETGAGGGADQGERGQVQRDGAGRGALAEHDVDAEVLHGGIQDLFDGAGQAVDLVDEQDVTGLELGEHGRQITGPLQGGPRGGLQMGAEFVGDDVSQGRLAQSRRAGEEQVVDRLAALASRAQEHIEMALQLTLADELLEAARTQSGLAEPVGRQRIRRQQLSRIGRGRGGSTRRRVGRGRRGGTVAIARGPGQCLGAGHARLPSPQAATPARRCSASRNSRPASSPAGSSASTPLISSVP